jgi:hypothetical protein
MSTSSFSKKFKNSWASYQKKTNSNIVVLVKN